MAEGQTISKKITSNLPSADNNKIVCLFCKIIFSHRAQHSYHYLPNPEPSRLGASERTVTPTNTEWMYGDRVSRMPWLVCLFV